MGEFTSPEAIQLKAKFASANLIKWKCYYSISNLGNTAFGSLIACPTFKKSVRFNKCMNPF